MNNRNVNVNAKWSCENSSCIASDFIQDLDNLKSCKMSHLFELDRGFDQLEYCVNYEYTDDNGQLKSIPEFKNENDFKVTQMGYREFCNELGKKANFSMSVSPRKLGSTRWISVKWAIDDSDQPLNESCLDRIVNKELFNLLSKYLTIHFKFSGDRSISIDIFIDHLIPIDTWLVFMDYIKYLIHPMLLVGSNLTDCMLLPFSRHPDTNRLCRYAGCNNEMELTEYTRRIERDSVDKVKLNQMIFDMIRLFQSN